MRRLLCALVLVASASAGCRSASVPPTTAPSRPPAAQPAAAAATGAEPSQGGTADLPLQVRWVRVSAEYQALVAQTYRAATRHVERATYGRTPGTWAVVLDADETVISNLVYQEERARAGLGYSPDSWFAWVRRQAATPLPGAQSFLGRVRELGGRIAIVTNRRMAECDDTRAVFKKHELAYDVILCRPDEGPSDKNPRFEAVALGTALEAPQPLDVVAFLGDNIQDFPGLSQDTISPGAPVLSRFGERYFVLPNPMYGSWER